MMIGLMKYFMLIILLRCTENNEIYIPNVREMTIVGLFQRHTTYSLENAPSKFPYITIRVGQKSVTYPFGHNLDTGRVDIFMNDHFDPRELYMLDLTMFVKIDNSLDAYSSVNESPITLKLNPNTEQEIASFLTVNFKYTIMAKLVCDPSYDSLNCANQKYNDGEIRRDGYTGNYVCVDPKNCLVSPPCTEEENICKNNGKCYKEKRNPENKYCDCLDGFGGPACEFEEGELDEDVLIFGNYDDLQAGISSTDCDKCPKQDCLRFDSFQVCTANDQTKTRFLCKEECHQLCGDRFCMNRRKNGTDYFIMELKDDEQINVPDGAADASVDSIA